MLLFIDIHESKIFPFSYKLQEFLHRYRSILLILYRDHNLPVQLRFQTSCYDMIIASFHHQFRQYPDSQFVFHHRHYCIIVPGIIRNVRCNLILFEMFFDLLFLKSSLISLLLRKLYILNTSLTPCSIIFYFLYCSLNIFNNATHDIFLRHVSIFLSYVISVFLILIMINMNFTYILFYYIIKNKKTIT